MVGTTGRKYAAIRQHLRKNISEVYNGLDTKFTSYPSDATERDPDAYKAAIDALPPGSAVTIFTPDPTHYPIALYAIQHGHHVLLTKPAVKTVAHHQSLLAEARKHQVFVYVEHHKRFDPTYADARHRARRELGDFNYFYAYMSQPKSQLATFAAWAGRESDISYYLNSHHVDVCASMIPGYTPVKVTGSASVGVAKGLGCDPATEDTITLVVEWESRTEGGKRRGTGVYTASWTAPGGAGVHSNQYFHYLGSEGEVRVNQGKRGYDVTMDAEGGIVWYNPFYMRYAPDETGNFAGQSGYGYVSLEKFVDAVGELKEGRVTLDALDQRDIPTLKNVLVTTAILEAGRRSIDEKRSIELSEKNGEWKFN
jgi:D-galacturonate reductase